jgi:hypothetical protein
LNMASSSVGKSRQGSVMLNVLNPVPKTLGII